MHDHGTLPALQFCGQPEGVLAYLIFASMPLTDGIREFLFSQRRGLRNLYSTFRIHNLHKGSSIPKILGEIPVFSGIDKDI
jgi:hypothetical protein